MKTLTSLRSTIIPLLRNNIDTDQIIPARYLKAIDKESVADGLFADWRFAPDGSAIESFVLNLPAYQNARILLAGDNFGCGSSREHAPWAITGWGIQVVISTSFADIFQNNALKNGLLPITVSREVHQVLVELIKEDPAAEILVDLNAQTFSMPGDVSITFEIDPFAKKCLLTGKDQLEYILSFKDQILEFEQARKEISID